MMDNAVLALIILIICMILFLTNIIPNSVTAMMGCVLFAVTGICTFSQAFSGFSNNTTIMVAGMLIVGDAIFNSGLAGTVSRFVIKASGNNERKFLLISILIAAVLSAFMANMVVITLFLAVMNTMTRNSDQICFKRVCMPIIMGAMFGGVCTLMGSTPQLEIQAIMESTCGVIYKPFDYTPVGVLLLLMYVAYVNFIWYPMSRRIWQKEDEAAFGGLQEAVQKTDSEVNQSRSKQIVMVLIIGLVVCLFATSAVPMGLAALIGALLSIITGCTTEKSALMHMDWAVLIRLAGCLGIASGLAESGCDKLIAEMLLSVFGNNINPLALLAVTVILAVIISNFVSNSTAATIVLIPVLSLCLHLGFNPLPFGLATCYGVNLAFATPLASAQIGVSMVAGYEFRDYAVMNFLLEIFIAVVVIIFVPLFYPFM